LNAHEGLQDTVDTKFSKILFCQFFARRTCGDQLAQITNEQLEQITNDKIFEWNDYL